MINVADRPWHQPLQQPSHAEVQAKDETISILKKQLEEKDEQIKTLMERMREANVLLKGYQDK
jgi:predicted RNase H-like nuclease (RuvC/YqgF family)